jgi:hypothetical protein
MSDPLLQQKRLAAAAIDIGVLMALYILTYIGGAILTCLGGMTQISLFSTFGPHVVNVVMSAVMLAYVLGRDIIAGDRSLGKKLTKIKVVGPTGPVTLMDSVKRNAIYSPSVAVAFIGAVLSAILSIFPFGSCIASCLIYGGPSLLAGIIALVAGGWEIYQIVSHSEGVRTGDKIAGTRVTW